MSREHRLEPSETAPPGVQVAALTRCCPAADKNGGLLESAKDVEMKVWFLPDTRKTHNMMKTISVGAALLALAVTGCHPASTPTTPAAMPPVTVSTVAAGWRTVPAFEEVVGSVQSRQRAELEAKVSARIERLPVAPGQRVVKGELLAQLDDREIRARLLQAEATLDQAQKDLKRFTVLVKDGTITQAEFDQVEARARISEAVKIEAETLLNYTRIEAPFDGVITRKFSEVGDLALPGRPLLALEDPNALRLEADVPEALIGRLRSGAELNVTVASVPRPIPGRVSEIAPAADPQSLTFRVKLDLPAIDGLHLGQFGRVAVPVEDSSALRVPAPAVLLRGQMEIVFVVESGHARLRLVKTGKRFGDEVELLSGVEAGELLVAEPGNAVRDGQPVKVQ